MDDWPVAVSTLQPVPGNIMEHEPMIKTLPYLPWQWLVAVPGIALCTLLVGSLCLLLLRFLPSRRVNRLLPKWWARINLWLIPATITVRGAEHIEPGQSYIVVANHLSHVDILALHAWLGMDLRFVMKQELRKVPIVGVTSAGLGYVFINRSNNADAVRALAEAKNRLTTDGASVLFFPEGTRSVDGRLHAFKKGAFVMAKDMGLPILPITLRNTDAILPAKTLIALPGRAEMIIHRPIALAQVAAHTVDQLMADTRAIIAGVLPIDRVIQDGGTPS